MGFKDVIARIGQDLLDVASAAEQDPLVQAAETTVLGPAGKTVAVRVISELEAWEAAHETDKQAAVATAYQQGHAEGVASVTPAEG